MSVDQSENLFARRETAWCLYDWANSGYTTLMITVFAVYIQRTVFSGVENETTGAVVWAWSVAASMLIGALLSPIVGALADARAGKRLGLAITGLGGGAACMGMAVLPPTQTWMVVGLFALANLFLELSLTFYNGFLPELVNDKQMNRLSAKGMGWGYIGGGVWLLLAMLILGFGSKWQLGDAVFLQRACIFLTGIWWALFTVPAILILKDRPRQKLSAGVLSTSKTAFTDVWSTLKSLRHRRTLALFLIAFLFYNDGLQTVISQSSTFALQELRFTDRELVAVILMVQFIAMPGAIAVGKLADRFGRKTTLECCLLVWIALMGSAWFVQTKLAFWLMSIGVAVVLGGTQAISRAIMGSLTPKQQEARYFGFFNFSGKATSFMGTFIFGMIVATTGSSRLAIVNLLVFFLVGLYLVMKLDLEVKTGGVNRDTENP